MVERSRRRRGMYHITKTRMLTTATLAAGAALFAGGANARIPVGEGDSSSGAQARVQAVVDCRFAITDSRAGSTRHGYVVGGVLIIPAQTSGQLSFGLKGIAETGVGDRFGVGVGFQYW
jgi:phage tail sheath gpL-like